ncbi:MAG: cytochrome-c peroxidase [Myxococcota bacterium]
MASRFATLLLTFLTLVLASSCGDTESAIGGSGGEGGQGGAPSFGGSAGDATVVPSVPWPVAEFPALPDEAVEVPEARLALGRLLFYDPVLSVDSQTACGTCHSEFWGMGDALSVGIGHGAGINAGPGREGPSVSRRNSQALFNLAFRETFLWDGRAESLEEQALMPLLAEEELNIEPDTAVARVADIPEYAALFADAFPDDPVVTEDNLAAALAAFQRTFISKRALYDAYVSGQPGTFDEELVEGMFRFAEFGCAECHAPPLFESEVFANRHVPSAEGVVDYGLAEISLRLDDLGKFRTPSLRNAFVTEPYFHNGSVVRLRDAVRHEIAEGGKPFTERDVELILGFVDRALRDTSRGPQRPDSVPSGLQLPQDAER